MPLTFAQWHWWTIDRRRERQRVEHNLVRFLSSLPRPQVVVRRGR